MSLLHALLSLPDLREVSKRSSPASPIVSSDPAAEALVVLNRLKAFTLPAGRIPAARKIADTCAARLLLWEGGEPIDVAEEPLSILAVLREIERALTVLGGAPNDELGQAVASVTGVFPSARLIGFRKLQ
jgi:hypothetical protein